MNNSKPFFLKSGYTGRYRFGKLVLILKTHLLQSHAKTTGVQAGSSMHTEQLNDSGELE